MPQDPLERMQSLLLDARVNPHALLLSLVTLLPESMLPWATRVAMYARDDTLRAFLLDALAKRLPDRSERTELTKDDPIPPGAVISEVSIPEGKEAKQWIAPLSEDERSSVFALLLSASELNLGMVQEPSRAGGGVQSAGPPDSAGGGGGGFGFAGGFESAGGGEPGSDDD